MLYVYRKEQNYNWSEVNHVKKFWILHRSNVQVWQSLSGKLVLHEACDQQKIDMSRCDLLARLNDHKWKTASLEESGVDCMFVVAFIIIW